MALFWSSGDGQSWQKQIFSQNFPFWDTNLAKKNSLNYNDLKLLQNCVNHKFKKMIKFGKMSVKLCRVGRVW